jgi:RNA polymerase primary sigma factor
MDPHIVEYRQNQLRHELLTADEERSLLESATAGDRSAVALLVEKNQRLVMHLALKYYSAGMTGDLDLLDLVQYGNLGLLEAIRRWDSRKNVRFSTYATWWIRAVVRRSGLTRGATVSRSVRQGEQASKIHRARGRLHTRLGREPHTGEIAGESRLAPAIVVNVLPLLSSVLSLDYEDDDRPSLLEFCPSTEDTAGDVERSLVRARLQDALDDLPPAWRRVLVMRYGYVEDAPIAFKEIGRRLGFSRNRAQEIERLALARLRAALEDLGPGD